MFEASIVDDRKNPRGLSDHFRNAGRICGDLALRRIGVRLCDGKPLNILFNAAAALVAGARPHELHLVRLLFVDVPGEEIYRRAGLRVATAAEVDQPIHDRYLRLLAAEERRDVTYHRPERLGDLLFNWFD